MSERAAGRPRVRRASSRRGCRSGRARRPARRPRRARAGRRGPPPTAMRLRARARPRAGRRRARGARRAREECVQPEPCAAPSGWRSPAISSTSCSPSKKTSVASLAVPAGDDDARAGRARGARARAPRRRPSSPRRRARAPRGGSGVTTVARGSSELDAAPRWASVVEQARAATRRPSPGRSRRACRGQQVERLAHGRDRLRGAEHADLDRVDADVLGDRAHLRDDRPRAARRGRRSPPTVFCAVIAVIAVIPCTPQRANAFRSAWIPAPPPESEPAIESTAGMRRRRHRPREDRRPASAARSAPRSQPPRPRAHQYPPTRGRPRPPRASRDRAARRRAAIASTSPCRPRPRRARAQQRPGSSAGGCVRRRQRAGAAGAEEHVEHVPRVAHDRRAVGEQPVRARARRRR